MAVQTGRLTGSRRLVTPLQLGTLVLAITLMVTLVYLWQARETFAPRLEGLSPSAIESSGAFVREQGAVQEITSRAIFGSGAYVREFLGSTAVAVGPEAIRNSGAHLRETAAGGQTALSHETWTQARESAAPAAASFSPQAAFNSGGHVRERAS